MPKPRLLALGLTFFALFQISYSTLANLANFPSNPRQNQSHYVPTSPILLRSSTFGYRTLASDMLWMRFIQKSDRIWNRNREHAASYYDLALGQDLDPFFHLLGLRAASLLTVENDDNRGATLMLQTTLKNIAVSRTAWPKDVSEKWTKDIEWQIYFTLGYIYLFELANIEQAEIMLRKSAAFETAYTFAGTLANRLKSSEGRYIASKRVASYLIGKESIESLNNSREYLQALKQKLIGWLVASPNDEFLAEEYLRACKYFKRTCGPGIAPDPQIFEALRIHPGLASTPGLTLVAATKTRPARFELRDVPNELPQ